jgi:hypothetical protein
MDWAFTGSIRFDREKEQLSSMNGNPSLNKYKQIKNKTFLTFNMYLYLYCIKLITESMTTSEKCSAIQDEL